MSVRQAPDFVSGAGAGEGGKLGWGRRDYVVGEESPQGRMLSAEEPEQEREQGHLVSPVSVGSRGGGGMEVKVQCPALYRPVRGIAR